MHLRAHSTALGHTPALTRDLNMVEGFPSFPRSAWERQAGAPRHASRAAPTQSVGASTEGFPSFPRSAWERQAGAPRHASGAAPTQSVGASTEGFPSFPRSAWERQRDALRRGREHGGVGAVPRPRRAWARARRVSPRSHAPRGNARPVLRVMRVGPRPRRAWARARRSGGPPRSHAPRGNASGTLCVVGASTEEWGQCHAHAERGREKI